MSILAATWAPPPRPLPQHQRSLSTFSKPSPPPSNRVSRAISSSALNAMEAASAASGNPSPSSALRAGASYNDEEENMSTIPDPRSRTMSPDDGTPPSPSHHPDLSDEVATLSTKLINAINHQTNLDDTLSATRHELESARERVRYLELDQEEHEQKIMRGVLVSSISVQAEKNRLLASLAQEKQLREETEREKKKLEAELENLTAELFEEANQMVSTARQKASKDHEVIQKKNDQLKSQLADMESLLKSQQEQLAELKQVMEQMSAERDDQPSPIAPSTPGMSRYDSKDDARESAERHSTSGLGDTSPSYPTSFTNLIQPVLRTDLTAYEDFTSLLRTSRNQASSRVSSGSYGGIVGLGLGLGGSSMSSVVHHIPSNSSSASLNTPTTAGSSPATPTTPASATSSSSINGANTLTPLRETKFYKRALAEDIEPTLRLDTAPGLSWLSRKSVLNAMCDGSLVVEPIPLTSTARLFVFACSLCGETRKDADHVRTHRFRTSESDTAQRYPLCKYCLGRVRSSCDFLGFLRMLKDGHWRTDGEESERAAWEESVRLREQMFWCRMGGGVLPVTHLNRHQTHSEESKSPRVSEEARKELEQLQKISEEFQRTGEIRPRDITPVAEMRKPDGVGSDSPMAGRKAQRKFFSDRTKEAQEDAHEDAASPAGSESEKDKASYRDSTQSTQSLSVSSDGKPEENRLSITIPRTSE